MVQTRCMKRNTSASWAVIFLTGDRIKSAEDKVPVRDPDRELRTYGVGAQIIVDLGIRKMRVLSAPWSIHGLAGFGLEVVEYVDCQ